MQATIEKCIENVVLICGTHLELKLNNKTNIYYIQIRDTLVIKIKVLINKNNQAFSMDHHKYNIKTKPIK